MILPFPHHGLARGRGTLTVDGQFVIPCGIVGGKVWVQRIVNGEVAYDMLEPDAVFISPKLQAFADAMSGRPCDSEEPGAA